MQQKIYKTDYLGEPPTLTLRGRDCYRLFCLLRQSFFCCRDQACYIAAMCPSNPSRFLMLCILLFSIFSFMNAQNPIDIHGHRGTRYWMPENSLEAFQEAIQLGAKWLELDLICTKDHQLIINHDPYFKKSIFSEFPNQPILQLNAEECKKATWGLKDQKKYPYQKKVKTHIYTLEELINYVENYCKENGFPLPYWNIEIKSLPHKKNWYPERTLYAKIVVEKIKSLNLEKRFLLQSFDAKLLTKIHQIDPSLPLYYLVIKPGRVEQRIKKLGFEPLGINPYYRFLNEDFVKSAHEKNLKVIPWTVNSPEAILKVKKMGVDGIISDVPDWVKFLITEDPKNYETLQNPVEYSEKFLQTLSHGGKPNLLILKFYLIKNLSFSNEQEQKLFYQNLFQGYEKLLKERNPKSASKSNFYKRKIIGFQGKYISLNILKKLANGK